MVANASQALLHKCNVFSKPCADVSSKRIFASIRSGVSTSISITHTLSDIMMPPDYLHQSNKSDIDQYEN